MVKVKFDLAALRKQHGLTQSELARKLGFSRSYIAMIEAKKQGFSKRVMHEIIKHFDVDYEDFYFHE